MPSLLDQVIDSLGFTPAFAGRIVAEACARCGVDAGSMGREELVRVLPHLQQALAVFLEPQEVNRTMMALRLLVRSSWTSFPAVTPPQDDPNTKSTSNSS